MSIEEVTLDAEERMEKAVNHLKDEFRGIRTGRATPAIAENIKVDYYGSPTPLKQVGNITAPEHNLVVIKPFDTSIMKDIEKAIIAANIGITPQSDGRVIRLVIPPLSGERRNQLATQIKKMAEEGRVSIRNIRRDANKSFDQLEKDKECTEDDRDEAKKEMDELTKKYVEQVDELLKTKTEEVMEV